MGLLDQLVGSVLHGIDSGQATNLCQSVIGMLGNQQTGSLDGLKQQFQQKGLGDVVGSWIGTGTNQPITADQIVHALGPERIDALAQKAGLAPGQGAQALAQILPTLVDRLTPNGQIPPANQLLAAGLELPKSKHA
jgi:uncharacterized protein YidB (DUF937 family)